MSIKITNFLKIYFLAASLFLNKESFQTDNKIKILKREMFQNYFLFIFKSRKEIYIVWLIFLF